MGVTTGGGNFITLAGGAVAAWPLAAFGKAQRILRPSEMRYRVVTDGGRGRVILDGIDMFIAHVRARGWHFDGVYEDRTTKPELQGHPVVRELRGPFWWDEGSCVSYEGE